ncbi:hypothetical protein BDV37DRAFT_241801 [Aspergillus pseudonomiae]|uniref:Uncharacterized protein n=1 Tax=Aspergillus pseudonomiae TaxID=1506151 RepID=A0A5N7DKS1_9EURO|nr:uncharacterized protein BDV37DRAFT_241801 [Aspergillus pseudonomiae]KAE8407042.1 hypothetical protein BDV37DRAFT_241801 [Aspergillus pseudonomiae]
MPSNQEEYLLPPLSRLSHSESDRPQASWSPFDPSPPADSDRSYIRYERTSSSHHEQDIASHNEAFTTVGLGIETVRRRPASIHFVEGLDEARPGGESRSPHLSEQATPRSHTSKTPLLESEVRCPHRDTIAQRWFRWVPMTILVLAVYATVWSGLYFFVACLKPRYGNFIGVDGNVAPSTANLLSAMFAKTIELAYVTVFVACLGQFLSRRALQKDSNGITISDMSMRTWIMQPGSMIVHWETLRYSALTFLGAMTLTATIIAMLYTTAAEALVSPKLLAGPQEDRTLRANVSTDFFNPVYMGLNCETPILSQTDPIYRNTTCLQIQHVGQAYHNYVAYLNRWSKMVTNGEAASAVLEERPPPSGSIHDNTTVTGSWIDRSNMTELSLRHKRMVLNVTAAMPHAGVLAAAKDPVNGLKQPQNSSEGQFDMIAAAPCPAINVLCVGMTANELKPLIYDMWPGKKFNVEKWAEQEKELPTWPDSWLNRTVVDDIFGWGPKYGWRPPIFGRLPGEYQTILNHSAPFGNAMYVLGKPPNATGVDYALCSMKAKKTPRCSVRYTASASGAKFITNCEKPNNKWQFDRFFPDAVDGNWSLDWKNIGSEWGNSLSLNAGINDGKASNARLLMQLTPSGYSLEPGLPSLAEALAVMAGNTLIMGTQNATFLPYWNHSDASLAEPEIEYFNATISIVDYQSAGTEKWQGAFFPVLFLTFVTSVLCLGYLLSEKGRQLTDFTEPQNLFALAINSPATSRLEGACGAGPQGPQFKEKWFVGMEEDDEHYYIRTKAEENTPLISTAKVSTESERPKSVSPALEEYRRLSTGQGVLGRWY